MCTRKDCTPTGPLQLLSLAACNVIAGRLDARAEGTRYGRPCGSEYPSRLETWASPSRFRNLIVRNTIGARGSFDLQLRRWQIEQDGPKGAVSEATGRRLGHRSPNIHSLSSINTRFGYSLHKPWKRPIYWHFGILWNLLLESLSTGMYPKMEKDRGLGTQALWGAFEKRKAECV